MINLISTQGIRTPLINNNNNNNNKPLGNKGNVYINKSLIFVIRVDKYVIPMYAHFENVQFFAKGLQGVCT